MKLSEAEAVKQAVLDLFISSQRAIILTGRQTRVPSDRVSEMKDAYSQLRRAMAKSITTNKEILEEIITTTEEVAGMPFDKFSEKDRERSKVEARQIIMTLYKTLGRNVTWREAGDVFGKKHDTALFSSNTVKNLLLTDKDYYKKWLPVIETAKNINPDFKIEKL